MALPLLTAAFGLLLAIGAGRVEAAPDAPSSVSWDEPALEPGEGSIWEHIEALDGQPPPEEVVVESDELAEERGAEFTFLTGEGDGALLDALAWYNDPLAFLTADPLYLDRVNPDEFDIAITINEDVKRWMRYFLGGGRKYYYRWLARSTRYRPLIEQELKARNMPLDLFYLAMIESGFNTNAYSSAAAVGIWQFIAPTGSAYKLRIDWWVDERRDPEMATKAATTHLKDLYAQFGDWNLCAAAYNCGPGCVRRAITRAGTKDYWTIVQKGALPSETANYVPKIIAAAIIGHHPERYSFTGMTYLPPMAYDKADVPGNTSVEVMAKCADISKTDFIAYNPALRRWSVPPDPSTYNVRIPTGKGSSFLECVAKAPPPQRIVFQRHRVKRGESLGSIASKYGVSVQSLAQTNNIKNVNRIVVGMELVIPGSGHAVSQEEVFPSQPEVRVPASVANTPNIPAPSTASSKPRATTPSTTVTTHKVKRGETLASIASHYGVTVAEIMSWNGIQNANHIEAGQHITVKGGSPTRASSSPASATPSATAVAPSSASSSSSSTATATHTVQRGETLSAIAARYHVTVDNLKSWNNISNASNIQAGQRLTVRLPSSGWTTYTVRKGDTLGAIATRYGCSVTDLKSWNALGSSTIYAGQSLKVKKK